MPSFMEQLITAVMMLSSEMRCMHCFQMFEAEEDGAITENELMCVLRTALGVGKLKVSRLFRAIDHEDTGKITFGKRTIHSCMKVSVCVLYS